MKKKVKISNTAYYEGEVIEDDIFHGLGKYYSEDRKGNKSILTGIFKKNQIFPNFGFWEMPDDELYEGELKDGKPHGKGKYSFSDGMIKEGIFENGQIKKTIKEYLYRDFVKKQTNMFIKESEPKLKDGKWVFLKIPSEEYNKLVKEDYFVKNILENIMAEDCKNLPDVIKELNIDYDYKFNENHNPKYQTLTFKDGSKFIGETKNNKMNGRGTFIFANGDKMLGQWKDDKNIGNVTITYANGETFVGDSSGKSNSPVTITLLNGSKYVGEYKDGKKNGQGTFTWANGDEYVGEFKDDKRLGQGTCTFSNGDKYVGEYKDDKYHGQGTFTWAKGLKYVGEFKEGKRVDYDLNYIKKNIDIKRIIDSLEYLESDDLLIDAIFEYSNEIQDAVYSGVRVDDYISDDEIWDKTKKELKRFNKNIHGTDFQKKIHQYIFDGSLLPKLNNNFKLEIYFEMRIFSHYLVYCKSSKTYYYISTKRKWNNKKNIPLDELVENYIASQFKKKPSKETFFKSILLANDSREEEFMEKNKSIEYEKRERLWEKTAYVSANGLDYIKLYRKTYDQYLKNQYS